MNFKLWLENAETLDYHTNPIILDSMEAGKKYHNYSPQEYHNTAKFYAMRSKNLEPTLENLKKYDIDPNYVVMARVTNPRDVKPHEKIERYWTHNPSWTVTQMMSDERANSQSQIIFTTLATLMKKGQVHTDPTDASEDKSAYLVTGNPQFHDNELIGKSQMFNQQGRRRPDVQPWSDEEHERQLKKGTMEDPDYKLPPPPKEFQL